MHVSVLASSVVLSISSADLSSLITSLTSGFKFSQLEISECGLLRRRLLHLMCRCALRGRPVDVVNTIRVLRHREACCVEFFRGDLPNDGREKHGARAPLERGGIGDLTT